MKPSYHVGSVLLEAKNFVFQDSSISSDRKRQAWKHKVGTVDYAWVGIELFSAMSNTVCSMYDIQLCKAI